MCSSSSKGPKSCSVQQFHPQFLEETVNKDLYFFCLFTVLSVLYGAEYKEYK